MGRLTIDMRATRRFITAALVSAGLALSAAAPVSAQAYPGGTTEERQPPEILGESVSRGASAPAADAAVRGTTLAVTGGDIIGLTLVGGGLIATGTVLARRRRTPATVRA